MTKIEFKPFTREQIEVKPTNTKYKGKCSLLLYIDSRVVGKILNESVGQFNWQIDYKTVGNQIYGTLSIWDDTKQQWIGKSDTGSATNIEGEKGLASDILKRCLARWGADYLYTAPDIVINCPDSYYLNDKMTMKFRVEKIGYNNNNTISELTIVDRFNKVVFDYSEGKTTTTTPTNNNNQNPPTIKTNNNDTPNNNTNSNNNSTTNNSTQTKKQELIQFILDNQTEENKQQITKFYAYYQPKMDSWRGNLNIPALWEKWKSNQNTV
jgi:hypothetical protein